MAFLSKTTGHVGRPNSLTSGGGQFRTIGHQRNAALVNLSGLTVTRNRRRGCFSVLPLVTYINHATDHDVYAVVVVYIAFAALALVVGYCAQVWIDERALQPALAFNHVVDRRRTYGSNRSRSASLGSRNGDAARLKQTRPGSISADASREDDLGPRPTLHLVSKILSAAKNNCGTAAMRQRIPM